MLEDASIEIDRLSKSQPNTNRTTNTSNNTVRKLTEVKKEINPPKLTIV